jgi:hypothetical protein
MRDTTKSPSHDHHGSGSAAAVLLGLFVVLGVLLLPFVPLLLALLETVTLGTNRVEDFCRQLGVHDELSALYETIFSMFR